MTTRREFLRNLSVGAATLATGIKVFGRSGNSGQGKDRKLGIALVGLGRYAGGQLAPALQTTKNCQLVGVVTGHPEKGEAWAAKYNLNKKNIYSYETMDRIADNPDIDIVYVVTPPGLHAEYAIRAAKAGKHVISEKPMETSVEACDRMIAACKKAKVKLSVGYRVHFDPYHKEMVRLASANELGPFTKMTGDFSFVMGQREFRIDKKLGGGGPLMDVGIYVIHAACMAAGVSPILVTAHEEPKARPDFFNEVEETIRFTMDFPNGAKLESVTSYNHNSNQFRAEGKNGWIEFKPGFSYNGLVLDTSRGPVKYPAMIQQAAQMDDFADCIISGRATSVPGELGRRDIQITSAIYEAARTGKPVRLKLDM